MLPIKGETRCFRKQARANLKKLNSSSFLIFSLFGFPTWLYSLGDNFLLLPLSPTPPLSAERKERNGSKSLAILICPHTLHSPSLIVIQSKKPKLMTSLWGFLQSRLLVSFDSFCWRGIFPSSSSSSSFPPSLLTPPSCFVSLRHPISLFLLHLPSGIGWDRAALIIHHTSIVLNGIAQEKQKGRGRWMTS